MKFLSAEHKNFCIKCLERSRKQDCYHQALFYTLGVSYDARKHIQDIFDFDKDCIRLNALDKEWQTSSSKKICLMAFNMWNGYEQGRETTPENLFNCEYSAYFVEAIKLRFEHSSLLKTIQDKGYTR